MGVEQNDPVETLRKDAPDLAMLFDAMRGEFDAKISSLKAWGVAMCLGGGAVGGFTATIVELTRPGSVAEAISSLPFS